MDTLIAARPYILSAFFLGLGLLGAGAFTETLGVMRSGGIIAHLALFFFLITESFGSVSAQRSTPSRALARVALFLSGLLVTSFVVSAVGALFSI